MLFTATVHPPGFLLFHGGLPASCAEDSRKDRPQNSTRPGRYILAIQGLDGTITMSAIKPGVLVQRERERTLRAFTFDARRIVHDRKIEEPRKGYSEQLREHARRREHVEKSQARTEKFSLREDSRSDTGKRIFGRCGENVTFDLIPWSRRTKVCLHGFLSCRPSTLGDLILRICNCFHTGQELGLRSSESTHV